MGIEGQIEGASATALGFAPLGNYTFESGTPINTGLSEPRDDVAYTLNTLQNLSDQSGGRGRSHHNQIHQEKEGGSLYFLILVMKRGYKTGIFKKTENEGDL
jgi:hypothetical protein